MAISHLPRMIEKRIRMLLEIFPGVVLTGARSVGKTSVAEQIAKETASLYLDLEVPANLSLLKGDAIEVLEQHANKLIVIDEVQKMPALFEQIRVVTDRERSKGLRAGKFLLISSASGRLMRQTGESLTGRVASIRMHGLNCIEAKPRGDLQRLWDRGGYPESFLADTEGACQQWHRQYLSHQFVNDLSELQPRISTSTVAELLLKMASLQGSPLNVSDLSNDLRISRRTVSNYLDVLECVMLIRKLPAFSFRPGYAEAKRPKYYVCDSGLLHRALKVNAAQILSEAYHKVRGPSWEGFVIDNLSSVLPSDWDLSYYRDHKGNEIDLVVKLPGGKLWAIAIKSGPASQLTKQYARALRNLQPERAFIVHGGTTSHEIGRNVRALTLEDMMKEFWANNDELNMPDESAEPLPIREDSFAELKQSIIAGASTLPVLRNEYLSGLLSEAATIVRESTGTEGKNGRLLWARAREQIVKPFAFESSLDNFAIDKYKYFDSMVEALECMLALKINGPGVRNKYVASFADLCAYDLFVSLAAALLSNARYQALQHLLTSYFNCKGVSFDSLAFRTAACRDSQSVSGHVFAHSSAARRKWFVEAELVIMLHSMLVANKEQAEHFVWYPHAFGDEAPPVLQFFSRTETQRGLEDLLLCLGEPSLEHLRRCFGRYSSRLDSEPFLSNIFPAELERKMFVSKWGRLK